MGLLFNARLPNEEFCTPPQPLQPIYASGWQHYMYGPGMWCDGLSLNRSGSFVQAWQMNS